MIPWFQYTTLYIGPVPIQVWGSFVAIGIVISLIIAQKRAKYHRVRESVAIDLFFYLILFGLIGARLFHVFFYDSKHYISFPLDLVKIWLGGLSSFGGFFGATAYFFYFVRKNKLKRQDIYSHADLFSFSAVYGWIIGRIGCFMIHDHLGIKINSVFSIQATDGARLEMSLLEIVGMIPLAILFFLMQKRPRLHGVYVFVLMAYYGVLRFMLDFFRATDIYGADARLLGLTPGQYFGIVISLFGVYLFIKKRYSYE